MRVGAEHFPYTSVQMVPGSRSSAGQAVGDGAPIPQGHETLLRLWAALPPWLQPRGIL